LRWRIRLRIRRFLRPIFRRPLPRRRLPILTQFPLKKDALHGLSAKRWYMAERPHSQEPVLVSSRRRPSPSILGSAPTAPAASLPGSRAHHSFLGVGSVRGTPSDDRVMSVVTDPHRGQRHTDAFWPLKDLFVRNEVQGTSPPLKAGVPASVNTSGTGSSPPDAVCSSCAESPERGHMAYVPWMKVFGERSDTGVSILGRLGVHSELAHRIENSA
jgi:hypothetical protein